MKTVLKWLGRFAAAVLLLAFGAAAYIFIASERSVARTYDAPLTSFRASHDSASGAEDRRQAVIHGCTSCHGPDLQGLVMFDEPNIARVRTPDITQAAKDYTDAELERLVRRGVKRDGTGAWIMPAATHMSDRDLSAIIRHVRSIPERTGGATELTLRAMGRIGVATGKFAPTVEQVSQNAAPTEPDPADPISLGRYLVKSACTECHGANLQGLEFVKSPSLMVSAAYQEEDFARLMRTGIGLGDRNLGKMTTMGEVRFSSFTDGEVAAIRAYLQEFVRRGGTEMP
jgi:cytochrome c553